VNEAELVLRLEVRPAANDDVLADLADHLGAHLFDRLARPVELVRAEIAPLLKGLGRFEDAVNESAEVVPARHEVRLRIHFHDRPVLGVVRDRRPHFALGRDEGNRGPSADVYTQRRGGGGGDRGGDGPRRGGSEPTAPN
jgi:hypothetical protein